MSEPIICEECRHPIDRHGPEGCDIELGDTWMDGEAMGAWIAQGPCGCSAVTFEEEIGGLETA